MATKSDKQKTDKTQTWLKNRERRILRAIKRDEKNAEYLLEQINSPGKYRQKPKTKVWSKTKIYQAKLIKMFCGRVDTNCFSSNPEIAKQALQSMRGKSTATVDTKVDFSILCRVNQRYRK